MLSVPFEPPLPGTDIHSNTTALFHSVALTQIRTLLILLLLFLLLHVLLLLLLRVLLAALLSTGKAESKLQPARYMEGTRCTIVTILAGDLIAKMGKEMESNKLI